MKNFSQLIKKEINTISDWPKLGILFIDLTPIFSNPKTFRLIIEEFARKYKKLNLDAIAAIDARGFIIGSALAYELGIGLICLRKQGKLPTSLVISESYEMEYGSSVLEVEVASVKKDNKILIVDDLIATGGTVFAAVKLLRRLNANIIGFTCIVDLKSFRGSQKLLSFFNVSCNSICSF